MIVFALAVEKTFEVVLPTLVTDPIYEGLPILLLVSAIFYFLVWDWILGRLLTLKNPFKGYGRFLLELGLAACAYGTLIYATTGKLYFLVFFGSSLILGGFWAKRTQREYINSKDLRELCVIQSLQFKGAFVFLALFIYWHIVVGGKISFLLALVTFLGIWCFIFSYELVVPRGTGLPAGLGVPFIPRSSIRKLRRAFGI